MIFLIKKNLKNLTIFHVNFVNCITESLRGCLRFFKHFSVEINCSHSITAKCNKENYRKKQTETKPIELGAENQPKTFQG